MSTGSRCSINRLAIDVVLLPAAAVPPAEFVFSVVPVAPSVLLVLFVAEALVLAAEAEGAGGFEGLGTLPTVVSAGGASGCPPPCSIRPVEPTNQLNG